jgi:hypothetical protein
LEFEFIVIHDKMRLLLGCIAVLFLGIAHAASSESHRGLILIRDLKMGVAGACAGAIATGTAAYSVAELCTKVRLRLLQLVNLHKIRNAQSIIVLPLHLALSSTYSYTAPDRHSKDVAASKSTSFYEHNASIVAPAEDTWSHGALCRPWCCRFGCHAVVSFVLWRL